jgi:hypothetical protein
MFVEFFPFSPNALSLVAISAEKQRPFGFPDRQIQILSFNP